MLYGVMSLVAYHKEEGPGAFTDGPYLFNLPSDWLESDQQHISIVSLSRDPIRTRLQQERRDLMQHLGVAHEQDVSNG